MPGWNIHNKWAEKMDISLSKKDLNFVNRLVDSSKECKEYLKFVNTEAEKVSKKKIDALATAEALTTHDVGRGKRKWEEYAGDFQIKFLRSKGNQFVKVWCLHHALDYISWFLHQPAQCIREMPKVNIEKILKKFKERIELYPEREYVEDFIRSNLRDVLRDCE